MNKKIIAVLVVVALVAGVLAFYFANPNFLQDDVSKKIKVETVKKGLEKKVTKDEGKSGKLIKKSKKKPSKDAGKSGKLIKKSVKKTSKGGAADKSVTDGSNILKEPLNPAATDSGSSIDSDAVAGSAASGGVGDGSDLVPTI